MSFTPPVYGPCEELELYGFPAGEKTVEILPGVPVKVTVRGVDQTVTYLVQDVDGGWEPNGVARGFMRRQ